MTAQATTMTSTQIMHAIIAAVDELNTLAGLAGKKTIMGGKFTVGLNMANWQPWKGVRLDVITNEEGACDFPFGAEFMTDAVMLEKLTKLIAKAGV